MTKLSKDFYTRNDVVQISRDLLGKYLFTKIEGELTAGIITETEAYAGITDKASHAYNNCRTNRTEIMFSEGGVSYIFLCYGIHHLFNVVTNTKDIPHAVLIRAVKPIEGIDLILKRRNVYRKSLKQTIPANDNVLFQNYNKITSGPGTVSQALGIKTIHNGLDLTGNKIWIEDKGVKLLKKDIIASPRIGVDYAEEDAKLAYRFVANL